MATFRIGSKARVNLPGSFAHNCECTVIATDAIVMHGEDCFAGDLVNIPNVWCALGYCIFKEDELVPIVSGDELVRCDEEFHEFMGSLAYRYEHQN